MALISKKWYQIV